MINDLKITIITDNNADGFLAEHGLALWIEADDRKILFDTGQSGSVLVSNAQKLGIDLSSARDVLLSHGHYDHTGGIPEVLRRNRTASVHCNREVFVERYSRQSDGSMRSIGMPHESSSILKQLSNRLEWVNEPKYLSEDIGITGPIPRLTSFEDAGGAFFFDPDSNNPDLVYDDLALWLRTAKGLCIVTGCCHSGLINTINYIQSLERDSVIHSVLGGFHLVHASNERLENTCNYLRSGNPLQIIACHCTGDLSVKYMQNRIGRNVLCGEVGTVMQINNHNVGGRQ